MPDPHTPTNSSDSSLKKDTHSITGAAGLIGVATFSSRILGFIRDVVLAQLFGASAAADAFYVAYRIPNLLRELFAEGSMSSAFIPVFTEYHTLRTKRETWELASAAFTTLLTIVTVVTILGILAAPGLVWLLAPGFQEEVEKLATTTLLTQVMFPYLVFISLAALAMGILNSLRAFAIPALAPVFFNLCILFFALVISPLMDQPILGVAIRVVVGGLAQFLMQLPAIHQRGLLFRWRFQPGHPGVKRMGRLDRPNPTRDVGDTNQYYGEHNPRVFFPRRTHVLVLWYAAYSISLGDFWGRLGHRASSNAVSAGGARGHGRSAHDH